MSDDAETYTQPEIVRLLKRLDGNIGDLREDVRRLEGSYVTRAEWELWKEANDRPKSSGWSVAGVVIAGIASAGSLITVAIVLIQNVR
jgi:hypothetical protein